MEPKPEQFSVPLSPALDKRTLNSSAMQFLVESNNLGYNVGILRVRVRMRMRVRMALGGDWSHLHFRIFLPTDSLAAFQRHLPLPAGQAGDGCSAGDCWTGRR